MLCCARLWWLLRWLGHDAVAVLDGGWQAWQAEGLSTTNAAPVAAIPGDFHAAILPATVDAGQVLANLGQGAFLVIDARSAGRFHDAASPFDTVAGHIPGARNRFFKDNLDAQGYFRDSAALRADFLAVLADYSPAEVVLQCGSGVTACHNALALEVAGLPGARLYPGSWSEWTADRARPVA